MTEMTTTDQQDANNNNNDKRQQTPITNNTNCKRFGARPEPDRVIDSPRSILGDRLLGNHYSAADAKLREEWRRNAEHGTHYASTPIENEGKYFDNQKKEFDNPLRDYRYNSSNDLMLPGGIVIMGEKKRLNNRFKKKQPARAKTFNDLNKTPSFAELIKASVELKDAHDKTIITGVATEKKKVKSQQQQDQIPHKTSQQQQHQVLQQQQYQQRNRKKTKKELDEDEEAEIDDIIRRYLE